MVDMDIRKGYWQMLRTDNTTELTEALLKDLLTYGRGALYVEVDGSKLTVTMELIEPEEMVTGTTQDVGEYINKDRLREVLGSINQEPPKSLKRDDYGWHHGSENISQVDPLDPKNWI